MKLLLLRAVALLSLANSANDNFKGVATLWAETAIHQSSLVPFASAIIFRNLSAGLAGLLARRIGLGFWALDHTRGALAGKKLTCFGSRSLSISICF